MQHFSFLSEGEADEVFHLRPQAFDRSSERRVLAMALGATLYTPATRPGLADGLRRAPSLGVVSTVVCLEDAIADDEVGAAQATLVETLVELARESADLPLVFVRVRRIEQVAEIVEGLAGSHQALAGFVLPKFEPAQGRQGLGAVREASARIGRRLWAMPVIESPLFAHLETRGAALIEVRGLLAEFRDDVLAVRIGATDLAAIHGLRRSRELTVYDMKVVADVIADVVNVLGSSGGDELVVTGPVWEHFETSERIFRPQLRTTPFLDHGESDLRDVLIARDLDALIREIVLDQVNGLTGKTVIHPSHVPAVHALSVVSHEEWSDAHDILGHSRGGARASEYGNKMNESNPHRAWAERILRRAQVFGVARPDVSFVELLGVAGRRR